jgi:hypothetical protein
LQPNSIFARIGNSVRMASVLSRRGPETFKSNGKPVSVGQIFRAIWQMDCVAMEPLQRLKHRTVVLREQAVRNMKSIVGIDADQMRVERDMMNFGQRDAVGHDWLSKSLVLVGDDVRGVKEQGLR